MPSTANYDENGERMCVASPAAVVASLLKSSPTPMPVCTVSPPNGQLRTVQWLKQLLAPLYFGSRRRPTASTTPPLVPNDVGGDDYDREAAAVAQLAPWFAKTTRGERQTIQRLVNDVDLPNVNDTDICCFTNRRFRVSVGGKRVAPRRLIYALCVAHDLSDQQRIMCACPTQSYRFVNGMPVLPGSNSAVVLDDMICVNPRHVRVWDYSQPTGADDDGDGAETTPAKPVKPDSDDELSFEQHYVLKQEIEAEHVCMQPPAGDFAYVKHRRTFIPEKRLFLRYQFGPRLPPWMRETFGSQPKRRLQAP